MKIAFFCLYHQHLKFKGKEIDSPGFQNAYILNLQYMSRCNGKTHSVIYFLFNKHCQRLKLEINLIYLFGAEKKPS